MRFLRLLSGVILVMFCLACQKNTVQLAEVAPPQDAPGYTVEPDLNQPGDKR